MPLTSAGYSATRAEDYQTTIRGEVEARLDAAGYVGVIDWARDIVWSILVAILAYLLGALDETVQAVYDARDPNNATGVQLDSISALSGVSRNLATASTVPVTLSGTAATVIPSSSLVEDDSGVRWKLSANATIGGGGTVEATFEATETGPISLASGSTLRVVTAVAGWTGAVSADDATEGRDLESDASLRARRARSVSIAGSAASSTIRSALEALDYVVAAVVLQNRTLATATVEGVSIPPKALLVVIEPSTLTDAQKAEVAETIYRRAPFGIEIAGSDESYDVIGSDEIVHPVAWDYADAVAVAVVVTLTLGAGVALADVEQAVRDAVAAYFDALSVGDDARLLPLYAAINGIDGIVDAAITLNGTAANVAISGTEIASLTTPITVS